MQDRAYEASLKADAAKVKAQVELKKEPKQNLTLDELRAKRIAFYENLK